MALPTTNITTTIVRNELGAATNNVGQLCVHQNVNMWSKRKPVRDSRLSIPANEVGVGSAQTYGLNIPAYVGNDSLLTAYVKPTGGASSPYRLGDFRGYNHSATPPVTLQPAPPNLEKRVHYITAFVSLPSGNSVAIGDIIGNLRLGVMVYESGGGLIGAASGENPGDGTVRIDLTGLIYTKLDIKFCLTDYYKSWETGGGMTALFEIPRKVSTENKNWLGLPLVTYNPPVAVPTFSVMWNPMEDFVEVAIKTLSYSGPALIVITTSTPSSVGRFSVSIPNSGEVHTFRDSSLNIISGQSYIARLWLSSTQSGAFAAETTFVAFQPHD